MKLPKTNLFNLGIVLLFSFIIFTFLVSIGLFKQIDSTLITSFQNYIPSFVDTPFSVFSILGSAEVTLILLFIILLLLFSGARMVYILGFFVMLGLIELFLKSVIPQIPPPIELLRTNLHIGFPSGEIAGDRFAYPSGHSGRTAFIAIILLFAVWKSSISSNLKQIFAFCILTFAFVMFVSRVYLAEHWITDVVGGALLGFSLALLGIYFYKNPIKFKKN